MASAAGEGSRGTDDPVRRVREALRGEPGVLCVGVTFLPADAIAELRWGSATTGGSPAVSAVCSRLAPDFVFVPAWEQSVEQSIREVAECGTAPFIVVHGPLTAVAEKDGWTKTLAATLGDTDALSARLDVAVEEAVALVREAATWGAQAVVVAEDVAGASGPLIAPDYVIAELIPRMSRIAAAGHQAGLAAIWHSDGDVRAFLRVAQASDFDAVHPAGLEQHVFETLLDDARSLGIAVLGGIPGKALRMGGPLAIRAGAQAALLAAPGGLLVCDDGSVSSGPELAALISALEVARNRSSEGA